jgi:hypothetical protein
MLGAHCEALPAILVWISWRVFESVLLELNVGVIILECPSKFVVSQMSEKVKALLT